MIRANREIYPRKRNYLNANIKIGIAILVLLLFYLFFVPLFFSTNIQKVGVYRHGLNHTITTLSAEAGADSIISFPKGISKAVKGSDGNDTKYETVLYGDCNSFFSEKKGRDAYKKVHPGDILWVENFGDGQQRLWVLLEEGSSPDPKFLELI